MAKPSTVRLQVQIEHVRIEAEKPFEAVKAALEDLVLPLDPTVPEALRQGAIGRAREALQRGPELAIFSASDHEIGNPLTATRMTQHQLPASLYAPLRVVLYENEAGHAVFEYDRPSSLFGQFGDERVTAVARELDASLERVLAQALHSGEER
jgi:hypothetical protein